MKIHGQVVSGHIVVQTPWYLTGGVYNVIDEFQFVSTFNLLFLQNKANWKKLILMSATPHVPLIASAKRAGIKMKFIEKESYRTAKRFSIFGDFKFKIDRIPPATIVFTTKLPSEDNEKIGVANLTMKTIPNKKMDRLVVHQNYVYGYNPPINVMIGVIGFKRLMAVSS